MERKPYISIFIIIVLSIFLICGLIVLTGCTEVNQVSHNIGIEADNFNVTRRIVVYNARTDKLIFELIGNFSLKNNSTNELEIVCEVGKGVYKKHFIYLNEFTLYVVEDVSGAFVDKYHYEVNFIPQQIIPFTFTMSE